MDFEFETTRTGLLNDFVAAGAKLLGYQPLVSAAVAMIPGASPQKYAIAGTLPGILQMAGKMMGEDAAEKPTGDLTPVTALTGEQLHKFYVEARGGVDEGLVAVANAAIAAHLAQQPKAESQPVAADAKRIASRLQSFTDRLCKDQTLGEKYEGDESELRTAINLLRHFAAHLERQAQVEQPKANNGPALASAIASIDRGEDDEGPDTPGIYTREEVLDMLKYEIVTDSGARTLRNGDGMEFNLGELALLANRAAHLARQSQQAESPVDQSHVLRTLRRLLDGSQPTDIKGAVMVIDNALRAGLAWSYDVTPPQGFIDYVKANYTGDVHFHDPEWHAMRLWNAAMKNVGARLAAPASQEGAHAAPSDRELLDFLDQWVKDNCAAGHHWFTFAFDTKKSAREQIAAEMALKTPASAEKGGAA
jgi:hypothetical protein